MLNDTAEAHIKEMSDQQKEAIEALNWVVHNLELIKDQYQIGTYMWLEAMYLKFLHHISKLTPKRYGPFYIITIVSLSPSS